MLQYAGPGPRRYNPTYVQRRQGMLFAATGPRECHGCRQVFPPVSLYCADKMRSQLSNSSSSGKGCAHGFCRPCLRTYVKGAVRARTYPVTCPMGASACGHVFDYDTLVQLLEYDTKGLTHVSHCCIRCCSRRVPVPSGTQALQAELDVAQLAGGRM